MQAVVAARLVVQQQGRGLTLSGGLALRGELRQPGREPDFVAQRVPPAIDDGGQRRIGALAQLPHDLRQRVIEVLMLAHAEMIAGHLDAAAKQFAPRV
jgi:hypothetical protein